LRWQVRFFLRYERGGGDANFGASIAFMGVTQSAFVHYFLRAKTPENGLAGAFGAARLWDFAATTSSCRSYAGKKLVGGVGCRMA